MSDADTALMDWPPSETVAVTPHGLPISKPRLSSAPGPEPSDAETRIERPRPAARRPYNPITVLLTLYCLGGVAPLALRMGPRKFLWAALSLVSVAAWVTLAWHWETLRPHLVEGRLPVLPSLAAVSLATCMGTVAWCRALSLVARDDRYRPDHFPGWVRRPWVTGVLGLLVPGLGLLVSGRGRRAGVAFWNAACVSKAVAVLVHAGFFWSWNTNAGVDGLPSRLVEVGFLASAVVLVLGGLMWIAGALEGMRVAALPRPWSTPEHPRRDLFALALLMAFMGFLVSFRPVAVARDLDRFASALRFEGYRLIPLGMELGASSLDPGQPQYAMRVAELHVEMGNQDAARAIHDRLRQHWDVYARMLLSEEPSSRKPYPSQLIQPGKR